MQVASLFRDNVVVVGSEITMNKLPESKLASLREEEETPANVSLKDIHEATENTLTSVTSLVSLASTALLGNDSRKKTEVAVENEDENIKRKQEEENRSRDLASMDERTTERSNSILQHDENDVKQTDKVNASDNVSQPTFANTSNLLSSSLLDHNENRAENAERQSPLLQPSLDNSLMSIGTDNKPCILKFNDCEASDCVPSSQSTVLIFTDPDNGSSYKNTLVQHDITLPQNSEIKKITFSSGTDTNIRDAHGCATNNISNINEMEAENLVIHHHGNLNPLTKIPAPNISEIDQLLHTQKDHRQKEHDVIAEQTPLDQSMHQHQIEYDRQEISRQQQIAEQRLPTPEERCNEVVDNGCTKQNQYTHAHQFHECIRNELDVEELSQAQQQNIREPEMTRNSLDPNVDVYHNKMQHMPPNINLINNMEQHHQYNHLNESQQQQLQHQHAQHLYLHQHMINQQRQQEHQHQHQEHQHHQQQQQQEQREQQQHQQQQQHSELMAYLHHQDQQNMQQPHHHIRSYQHYQQQQQRLHQLPHVQPQSPINQQKHASMTCIDDLMIDEFHDEQNNRYKLMSPTVKHESQDDGYETSAGDVLTPSSHSSSHSMTPQHQIRSTNMVPPKCEDVQSTHHGDQDAYNFIDDEINSNVRMMSPSSSSSISMVLRQQSYGSPSEASRLLADNGQQSMRMDNQLVETNNAHRMQAPNTTEDLNVDIAIPKKRGRKKKSAEELSARTMVDGVLKPILQKERKKHDRFNGMPEEEVSKRTLPDHLADNLDIIIIGINPGLFAAYKGHHYAGPGNHFWKCLYLSGLTQEQMTAEEDYKLLKVGIGFTNMVERATKGSADLTRKEIKEGSRILLEKLKRFRPKIAVFNGKLIFEVFSGKKDFNFGRQQECVEGTDTYMWVMPSSSARCAQLPRAADKVPFYAALKKFRDYLNGHISQIDDLECVFNHPKTKHFCEPESKGNSSPISTAPFLAPDCLNNETQNLAYNNSNRSTPERANITDLTKNLINNNSIRIMHKVSEMHPMVNSGDKKATCGMVMSGMNGPNPKNFCNSVIHMPCHLEQQSGLPEKKKRGRPKKIKGIDGEDGPIPQKVRNTNSMANINNLSNLTLMGDNGETQKKKRGRPKKIKIDNGASIGPSCSSNSNNNNVIDKNGGVCISNPHKTDICIHRSSPSGIGTHHQLLTINDGTQFNSQALSQQQSVQNQRLFSSPINSPNNVSSYCPIGINAPTTPPMGNANSNNSNLGSSGTYHQQHHGNIHHVQQHQHNHVLQRLQHQLHTPPGMYMPSPNFNQQNSSKSPHFGSSSHSDISAAISSEHLGESQSESSPTMGPVDYDRPESIPNEEHGGRDLRFASPASNAGDSQQASRTSHQSHYHSMYLNTSSNPNYIAANGNVTLCNSPGESATANSNDDSINYIVSNRLHTSNSNTSTPQPSQMQNQQQQNMQVSDVTSKSLSGLESLVDQIPTINEADAANCLNTAVGSVECRAKSDSNEGFPSPASCGSGPGSSTSGGVGGCIYIPSYSNLNSCPSSPSSVAPSNSSVISPHHYPDPIYSTATSCPSASNTNSNNNINYNGLASNFSVSSLTSSSYPANPYHTNLMTAASAPSPHHITSTASGSPMYMDPHMPVAVSPIYHHPFAQHAGYGAYSSVGPPPPPPPTLHVPSPNYPYSYSNTSGYSAQSVHHPSHTSSAGYLSNHPSMFDRIKPDIGYGGY